MIWTILIFLIALPFMWKFVFGPITKALETREDQTRDAAAAAEEARGEIERMKAGIQEDLENARREAAEQVNAAKARAADREKELLAAAKEEAAKERARALLPPCALLPPRVHCFPLVSLSLPCRFPFSSFLLTYRFPFAYPLLPLWGRGG